MGCSGHVPGDDDVSGMLSIWIHLGTVAEDQPTVSYVICGLLQSLKGCACAWFEKACMHVCGLMAAASFVGGVAHIQGVDRVCRRVKCAKMKCVCE